MSKLTNYLGTRDNNCNLIRFMAAVLVLYSHSFDLYGMGGDEPLVRQVKMSLGSLAVDIFFVTSGFLIAGSYYNRNDMRFFIRARVVRIFPALLVATFLTVCVLGVCFTTCSLGEYFTDFETYKYWYKNSLLIFNVKYFLPGVFESVPYSGVVNGSLWTLPYELKCYIILALLAYCLLRFKANVKAQKLVYLVVGVGLLLVAITDHYFDYTGSRSYRLFAMFFGGASLYMWRDHVVLSHWVFGILMVSCLALLWYAPMFEGVYLIAIFYLVLYLTYVPSGSVRLFNKVGDYSYGLYIYAFPVQQSVLALHPDISFVNFCIIAFLITFTLACLSWHLLEKRCLKFRYVKSMAG